MKAMIVALLSLALAIFFSLWTFTLTDAQLLYSNLTPWVTFQHTMMEIGKNIPLTVGVYIVLCVFAFALYGYVVRRHVMFINAPKKIIGVILCALTILAISNPALSYDIFNYIFDARLVLVYHKDPHFTAAFDYMQTDEWTRFMRNVFFPTTYGYVWTALSLVPSFLGFGKFVLTFLAFKAYVGIGLGLLLYIQLQILTRYGKGSLKKNFLSLFLFFGSPFVLIEVLSSGHNDVFMMVLAFASLFLLFPGNLFVGQKIPKTVRAFGFCVLRLLVSFALLYASAQVKRSTALLLPIWGAFSFGLLVHFLPVPKIVSKLYVFGMQWWADASAVLLFLPLFTGLSRQFQPWYLLWSFSCIPFIKSTWLRVLLICFSFTSIMRYVPYLSVRVYSEQLLFYSKIVTWSAVPLWLILVCTYYAYKRLRA